MNPQISQTHILLRLLLLQSNTSIDTLAGSLNFKYLINGIPLAKGACVFINLMVSFRRDRMFTSVLGVILVLNIRKPRTIESATNPSGGPPLAFCVLAPLKMFK